MATHEIYRTYFQRWFEPEVLNIHLPCKQDATCSGNTNSEGKPLYIRLTPVAGFTYEALKQWSAECLSSTARVVSDGLGCFGAVTHTAAQHARHIVGSGKSAVQRAEFRWVNTLPGNLKTAFSGTYHAFNHAKLHRVLSCRILLSLQPPL
ncbi:transposase [Nitrosomonas mobilis]|uniref:transposase n=1 Tax=Nitrosomonas mobilis TaxID=51642 RepID=UPI000B7C9D43|nr:transposase [Nitrosomonas mobilis]